MILIEESDNEAHTLQYTPFLAGEYTNELYLDDQERLKEPLFPCSKLKGN